MAERPARLRSSRRWTCTSSRSTASRRLPATRPSESSRWSSRRPWRHGCRECDCRRGRRAANGQRSLQQVPSLDRLVRPVSVDGALGLFVEFHAISPFPIDECRASERFGYVNPAESRESGAAGKGRSGGCRVAPGLCTTRRRGKCSSAPWSCHHRKDRRAENLSAGDIERDTLDDIDGTESLGDFPEPEARQRAPNAKFREGEAYTVPSILQTQKNLDFIRGNSDD